MLARDNDLRRLRVEADRYQTLVERVDDHAIFMLDPNGVVLTWNPGAERIMGYAAKEIVGHDFARFFTPKDRAAGKPEELLETALHDGLYEVEQIRFRKDGSRFWAHIALHALRGKNARPIGFAISIGDVTELVRIKQELGRTRAALAQVQKMEAIGQFAGGMAHDFGNVLMGIQLNLESLERSALSPSDQAALQAAIAEVERGMEAIRSLLMFSRRGALEMRLIDPKAEIERMGGLLHQTIGAQSILEMSLAGDLWPIQVNANQLELALLNVALNARDAMAEGGCFRLAARNVRLAGSPGGLRGEFVAISATDTGGGMPPEVSAKAIEPFFTTKGEGKGTGLGLGQVFGFAKSCGGAATLDSAVGKGTTVTIYVPRHRAAKTAA